MALPMESDHCFAVYTVWDDPQDDERCIGWVRNVFKGIERYAVGSYLGDADFGVRKARFWSDEAAERLKEVRRKWDGEGRMGGGGGFFKTGGGMGRFWGMEVGVCGFER